MPSRLTKLTVVVDYVFYITHDLSVSALGNAGLLVNSLCIFLEYGCWLRMQNKRDCEETLQTNQYCIIWLELQTSSTLIHSICGCGLAWLVKISRAPIPIDRACES